MLIEPLALLFDLVTFLLLDGIETIVMTDSNGLSLFRCAITGMTSWLSESRESWSDEFLSERWDFLGFYRHGICFKG